MRRVSAHHASFLGVFHALLLIPMSVFNVQMILLWRIMFVSARIRGRKSILREFVRFVMLKVVNRVRKAIRILVLSVLIVMPFWLMGNVSVLMGKLGVPL